MIHIPADDRLELLDLVGRYAFRCDTGRYGEIAELFTADGVFDETVSGCRSAPAATRSMPPSAPSGPRSSN